MTLYETSALTIGTALTLVAIVSQSLSAYLTGLVIAGTGNGLWNLLLRCPASHRPAVSPEERGKLFVLFFMLSYLAFGLTAVLAGMAVGAFGLTSTALGYGALIVLFSTVAGLLRKFRTRD